MRTIIFLLSFSLISGCGYTTRSLIDPSIKTIYIKPLENKIDFSAEEGTYKKLRTYYPRLETDITTAIVERFIFDGNLKVVKEQDADIILSGELVEYRRDVLRYDEGENVEEYRLNIIVNISLNNVKEQKTVWTENRFTGETDYFVSGSKAISESTAIKNGITDLARRIVERTIENW